MKMKKNWFLCLILMMAGVFAFGEENKAVKAPFTKGVNLTTWFEIWSPGIPNLRKYDRSDFEHIKELGCDVIRLPIHFAMFYDEKGKIKPIIFEYLDKACDWAEELGLHLIIDNHSFNSGDYPSAKEVEEHLLEVWPQIAKRYKNRSDLILYEILNEPRVKEEEWFVIQKKALDAIRKVDKKRAVVVTGADWGGLNAMSKLKVYEDENLIYSFHFYDPFYFTHQGANWSSKEVADLEKVPFPYDKDRLPVLKGAAKTSWVQNYFNGEYKRAGTVEALKKQLQKAVDFSVKNNVPVFDGEMGVYNAVSPEADRNIWYEAVGGLMKEFGIPFCVWGYDGSFGIFKKGTAEIYPYDLNVEVVAGLGMKVPSDAGKENPMKNAPLKLPFTLYDDFATSGVNMNCWNFGTYNADFDKDKSEGAFCVRLGNGQRYGSYNFGLERVSMKFLEERADRCFVSFDVKFTKSEQEFQLRFVDSDDGTGELPPWRLIYPVNAKDYKLGEWVHVEIPIGEMKESGAWSNSLSKWFNARGEFSWARVLRLEFSAENCEIPGFVYLDNIKIIEK